MCVCVFSPTGTADRALSQPEQHVATGMQSAGDLEGRESHSVFVLVAPHSLFYNVGVTPFTVLRHVRTHAQTLSKR